MVDGVIQTVILYLSVLEETWDKQIRPQLKKWARRSPKIER
jgi:hypothetical protein